MDRSYSSFVQILAAKNPSLGPLAQAPSEMDRYGETSKAIGYLEVGHERIDSFQETGLEQVLDKISDFKKDSKTHNTGVCILVGDIHSSAIFILRRFA